jgi:hypothetical protein
LMAKFINNPTHAQQYFDQLDHIYRGIGTLLGRIPITTETKS